ncbi:MAG: GTP-binding protein [Thermoprotei archaeon]|nr:MAG: GTP-binding protein [Thermoprotei archaeon]RLF03111.1 MAG: GTP-binding protein [Thermoprotei archaeon]
MPIDIIGIRRAWRNVRRVIGKADIVLEVVDARDPLGTRSSKLENLVKRYNKPLIIVINKADLVPRDVLEKWKYHFEKEYPTIYIGAKNRLGTTFLWKVIKKVAPQDKRVVRVAVTGFPNVGKSTIINVLKGRHSASTSPKAGHTKHVQEFRAAQWLKVIDTPGIIPIEEDEEALALRFALNSEQLSDPIGAAIRLIRIGLNLDPTVFRKTYGIEHRDPEKILEELAKKRGFLLKGGKLNIEEAARVLLRDWLTGKLVFYYPPPSS